jgi:hypothetical protein
MAPEAAQPIKHNICKNPLSELFLLPRGPKFEIKDGRSWARAGAGLARRSWARVGAGHAPPPAGRGRSTSRGGGALQERRRGQAPPPAVPHRPSPTLPLHHCPELPPDALVLRSSSEGSSAGAPLSVEVLRAGAPLAHRLHQIQSLGRSGASWLSAFVLLLLLFHQIQSLGHHHHVVHYWPASCKLLLPSSKI